MLEFIEGKVVSLSPVDAVVQTAGGVGFLLNITLPTYTALQGRADARLYVHESIREDAWVLYGFIDDEERALFRQLVGVSGVGAATARMILSAIAAPELGPVIATGDVRRLKSVKGVGAKTAERIIVDLRDKIKQGDSTLIMQTPAANDAFDEALAALTMLGFPRPQSQKVLTKLFQAEPTLKVEAAIKKALSML